MYFSQQEEPPSEKGVSLHLTLKGHVYKRLYRVSKEKGVNEQSLCRLFIAMGLDLVEGKPFVIRGDKEE